MKKLFYYSALSFALMLNACSSLNKSNPSKENSKSMSNQVITDKKWKLIELEGKPVADKINGKEPFILLQKADNRYSASAGCNGLGGNFEISDNNRIKFTQGMSTMMACDHMEIETGLNRALVTADNYTVGDNTLSINKGRMAALARFKVVTAPVASKALNGTWELDYISGPRIAFDGLYPNKKPTIIFDLSATKANGNSGCNNYNTTFTIDGNNIRFADPMSTKMACEGIGEATFFKTLKTISKYDVSGTTLNLIMGDIAVMRFKKK
ncbi:META domain-containing protein [Pedobacter sp. MC2016-24]|uniref:META domain-containing protein n=1 Tax=Pedobacter sp. MC2016-24 TaxID=2780090 RepID=UPI00187E2370|nr:META domain-containing protein [Pedobacter sp. MC2016-24]MBE9600464.1 META domain-containing protein [Pedobacter sp. MC2016-24]